MRRLEIAFSSLALAVIFSSAAHAQSASALSDEALQTVLAQSSAGFAGIPVTQNDNNCESGSICYDVNGSVPSGFTDCSITVDKSDSSSASEFCVIYRGSDEASAQAAWSQTCSFLRSKLPSWKFRIPKLGSFRDRLVAEEPTDNGRSIYLGFSQSSLEYKISIDTFVNNAGVH